VTDSTESDIERKAEAFVYSVVDCCEVEFGESGIEIDMPKAIAVLLPLLRARAAEEAKASVEHEVECYQAGWQARGEREAERFGPDQAKECAELVLKVRLGIGHGPAAIEAFKALNTLAAMKGGGK
jgi:hypothetical protein